MDTNFKWIKSDKFSNVIIYFSFTRKVNRDNLLAYSLLPSVINIGTVNYPTKKLMNKKTSSLYNMSVGWTNSINYDAVEYQFMMDFINPSFLSDKNYLKDVFDFAYECMFNPLTNNDKTAFDEKNFKEKKLRLANTIKNIKSNKDRFAYYRFMEEFRRSDEGEYQLVGTRDASLVEKITNEELYKIYQDIFTDSEINIAGIGNIDESEIIPYIEKFNLKSKKTDVQIYSNNIYSIKDVKKVIEYDKIDQAKLYMGYRTDINCWDKMTAPLFIMSIMFGGLYNSTLTNVVRSNNSLCYDISFNYLISKQYAYVSCGTFNDKVDDVISLVNKELKKYQDGQIEDAEEILNIVKETIKNDYRQFGDQAFDYVTEEIRKMGGRHIDRKLWYDNMLKVTIEDVIEASKLIRLDTIYVLKEKDNE